MLDIGIGTGGAAEGIEHVRALALQFHADDEAHRLADRDRIDDCDLGGNHPGLAQTLDPALHGGSRQMNRGADILTGRAGIELEPAQDLAVEFVEQVSSSVMPHHDRRSSRLNSENRH